MIYLFDDKMNRQLDYGWNKERFTEYSKLVNPIYFYSEIKDDSSKEEIFSKGNIILFHESFFDNALNVHKEATQIRTRLNRAQENKDFQVVYFSGSKSSRKFDENIGHIPVSLLYQNLEVFLKNVESGKKDLRYLFFGENFQIEENLVNKLENANRDIEDSIEVIDPVSKNFIALTLKNEIDSVFDNADYETFFLEKEHDFDITDEYLSKKVKEWFSEDEFDNVFIPLCFGPILSDYNGLRFALHIRNTDTPNRLKNIFLYSFVDVSFILTNKYFDVLKTRNVSLINYTKKAFKKALISSATPLEIQELKSEIEKVKLEPPKNYEDSHSIANEWAIYRWASALKAKDDEIEVINNKIQHQLYFKYLQTIYPVKDIHPISESSLKIKYSGNPQILYIDDEADKGWYEIFCTLLVDNNDLDLHYLDGELKNLTREEIIEKSLETIETKNIDIVLLDFRLHPDDFNSTSISEVTGLKILKRIKEINPGIQVIIFSATKKVWNLQALQKAGADGFIVKESPENSVNSTFTNQVIISFILELERSTARKFLKESFTDLARIKYNLNHLEYVDDTDFHFFLMALLKQVDLIIESINQIEFRVKSTLDIVFLNCYNLLEQVKNDYYLKFVNNHYVLGLEEKEMNRYSPTNQGIVDHGLFIPSNYTDKPSWFNTLAALLIDYFEVCNINDNLIKSLNSTKNKRNNFIHNDKSHFNRKEIKMIIDIISSFSKNMKE